MPAKTPDFDQKIDEILQALKPHTRKCRICDSDFEVMAEDIEFYKKFKVPPPTLCPKHRRQRRLVYRNERSLFERKCDSTGEKIISIYRPDSEFTVWDERKWWDDSWDATEYARGYDFSKPFFEQFSELRSVVPRSHAITSPDDENVKFSNYTMNSKDCYMNYVTYKNQGCYFGSFFGECKDCLDLYDGSYMELCYEMTGSGENYNCRFGFDVWKCRDSDFLLSSKDSKNCFMSSNLRHKEYVFRDQQLTKEEYEKKIAQVDFGSYKQVEELKEAFNKMYHSVPVRNVLADNCENSYGNQLTRCLNCYMVFGDYESENLRYCSQSGWRKDCMDVDYAGIFAEYLYEVSAGGPKIYMTKFSNLIRGSRNLEYCDHCFECQDCFGCVGLRKKKYCILNRQYSKKEYFELLDKIKSKMLNDKEYGEFFPFKLAVFPYIDTPAYWFYPETRESLAKIDPSYEWVEAREHEEHANAIEAEDLPDNIKDVRDDILEKIIICQSSKKPFRIIRQELDFYRKQGLPIPRVHPERRDKVRFDRGTVSDLYEANCTKCDKLIDSRYKKEDSFKVYCEECYSEIL